MNWLYSYTLNGFLGIIAVVFIAMYFIQKGKYREILRKLNQFESEEQYAAQFTEELERRLKILKETNPEQFDSEDDYEYNSAVDSNDETSCRYFKKHFIELSDDLNNPKKWYQIAKCYACMGIKVKMLTAVEKTLELQPEYKSVIINDHEFDKFRYDPDFLKIIA